MKLSLKETQTIELSILKEFHCYCEQRNYQYILGFGTLLGSVRHGGFIPWDNDIDVLMPRRDFELFLKSSKKDPISDSLYVQHYTLDEKYHYICARVCDANTQVYVPYIREQPTKLGLWIDIFPLDGVGEKSIKHCAQQLILKWYWMLFRADVYGSKKRNSKNLMNYIIKKIALILFPNRKNKHNYSIDRICKWYSFEKCKEVAFLFGEEGVCKIPRSDFDGLIKMPFEDEWFYGPPSYKLFLEQCYGDYMTLPKQEDRITHDIDIKNV